MTAIFLKGLVGKINLPIILTLSRIALIPVFIVVVYQSQFWGAVIFSIAAITDFFDGYFARRSGQITKFGQILDPLADKFLIISALIILVDMIKLPSWIAIVIIVREFFVTGLRVVALSKDIVIPAEAGGKLKTVSQIIAILALLLSESVLIIDLYDVGIIFIWLALVLAVVSGIKYTFSFWKNI